MIELRGITWDHVRGIGGLRAAAAAYGRIRPDVRVTWTTRSLQAFADQPVEQLAWGFDLLNIDHPALGHAVARASLVPLDERLDQAALEDQIASGVGRSAESYEWHGRRWALATDAAAQVAAFRPDLLERAGLEVPRTWDEAVGASAALRGQGLWAAMPAIPVDAICAFLAVCVSPGEELFGDDRVVSPELGRAALDVLASFVASAHPSSLDWNPPRMLEHMAEADDVAYCPLAFGYSNYSRPGFRSRQVRFAAGPSGPDGVPRGTLGGAGLAVSAHGEAIDEAVRYAAFVADPATQRGVYFEGGGQPGHRSAWTDPDVNAASGGFFADTLAAMDAAYLRPRYDGFLAFQDEAGAIVHAHLRNHDDAGATLDRLDSAYRASLAAQRV
ncbi:MAG: extracellular solute-binding protein [Actinomycetota bacterium]